MSIGRLVEARVYYACGCDSRHPTIYEKHLACHVQECATHGDHRVSATNPGRRIRIEKLRFISADEEWAMTRAAAFAMGSVHDAQMEDQDVRGF